MSETTAEQIAKDILSAKNLPQVIWISAPEALRPERVLSALKKTFKFSLTRTIQAQELSKKTIPSLIDSLCALSLFSEPEVILLKDAHKLDAAAGKVLAEALNRMPPEHPSTLIATGLEAKATHPLLKFAQSKALAIEFVELADASLSAWCRNELKRQGIVKYDASIPELLATLSKGDLCLIATATEQASIFLDGDPLTPEILSSLFPGQLDVTEFQLIDSIIDKQLVKAESSLHKLLDRGGNAFGLLGLLTRNYQTLLAIHSLQSRGITGDAAARSLGMPAWLYKKQLQRTEKYSLFSLRSALEYILNTDARLKNKSMGQELELSRLIQQLTA